MGILVEGKEGLWIQDCLLMGYIGEAPADVVVPEGVEGIALEDVKRPKQLRDIGAYTFEQCSALEHITLPNGLEKIGDSAFYGDARLEEINLSGSLKHVGSYAFDNYRMISAMSFADELLYLGERAYDSCSSVQDVYPSSVTNISSYVFNNYSAITNITTATAHRTMSNMFSSVYNKLVCITIAPAFPSSA